jgi:glycosyltransferase involved in cell wall biosynthesis
MRIAYLIHQDPNGRFGGSEVYAAHLARAAREAGHQVLLMARGDGRGEPIRRFSRDGIDYAILDTADLTQSGKRFRLQESFDNPHAYIRLTRLLTEFSADHLHVHHFLMTSAGLVLWARQNDIPVTATLHDYWAFCHRLLWQLPDGRDCPGAQLGLRCRGCGKPDYNRWPGALLQPAHTAGFVWRNFLLRRAYRAANAVFAPSRAVLDAHRANGFAKVNFIHRPYGLPAAAPVERAEPRRPLVVGYLGRLAPEKGIETLIDAARLAPGIRVKLFGHGDALYTEQLTTRAAGAPVGWGGSFDHDALHLVLAGLDAVAVPSVWRENLPLAALEAAQRTVPVLVAPRGGLSEVAELTGAGLVTDATPKGWAAALTALCDPATWRAARAAMHYDHRIEDDLAAHLAAGEAAP